MKLHSVKEYLGWAKENAYVVTACVFAVVAVAGFATGHPFVGVLAIAGMGLSGSVIIKDGLQRTDDNDDDIRGI